MAEPRGTSGKAACADQPALRGDRSARMLQRVFEIATAQLEVESELPGRHHEPAELREALGITLGTEGVSFDEVAGRLSGILAETPSPASPRFFNQLFGGRDDMATLAEMLTPLVNSSMYTYKVAGPQVLVEQEVLARMALKAGYTEGEGALCPGGSLASLTAMLIARNEAFDGAREVGLGGTGRGQATLYTSADGHYSIRKNAGILGLGRASLREIATDHAGRMEVEQLRRRILSDRKTGLRPLFINATAGTTVLGAFDPIDEIADVAREEGLWLHVDGALGGSALLSDEHRELLAGTERADSFVWNAHKMMGVPLPCSALLLKRRGLLAKHLGETAGYLFQTDGDELNPGTRSLQCGRRNDALKLWAAWKLHGDLGFDRRIGRLFELARHAAAAIEADPEFELLMQPESINVCFEVRDRSSIDICDRLRHEGRLLIGHGSALGRQAIRLVCINPDLEERDIDNALAEIRRAARALTPTEAVASVAR